MIDADMVDRAGHAGQSVDNELIRSEFRKVACQLGELRRRETKLLRKVALLELELGQALRALESQLPESMRLRDELAEAQRRAAELEGKLAAQAQELHTVRRSTSWYVIRPLRVKAKRIGRLRRRLKRQPADLSAT